MAHAIVAEHFYPVRKMKSVRSLRRYLADIQHFSCAFKRTRRIHPAVSYQTYVVSALNSIQQLFVDCRGQQHQYCSTRDENASRTMYGLL